MYIKHPRLIISKVGQGGARGPHYPPGRARGPWRALVPCGPHRPPLVHFLGSQVVFFPKKKIAKKFRGIWTSFGTDILRSKKQAKTATGTGHYVNRLIPKNDIKLI